MTPRRAISLVPQEGGPAVGAAAPEVQALAARLAALEERVGELAKQIPSDRVTIVVFSGDFDKLVTSFIMATGAAAMGSQVSMFFTFWGLHILKKETQFKGKSLTAKMLAAMLPAGPAGTSKMNMLGVGPAFFKALMRKKKVASLEELIALAVEMEVKMTACTTSMDLMGVRVEELRDGVSLGGVATYLQDACDSRVTLFI
jgi:peroxiredoxin family protein